MYRRITLALGVLLAITLGAVAVGLTGTAGASPSSGTLGLTTEPAGASVSGCDGSLIGQLTDTPTTPYLVPSTDAGFLLQSWSSAVTGDTPGDTLTLWVLAPSGGGYTVVGTSTQTIPSPLPAGGIATFTLSSPITVQSGDTFALTASSMTDTCYWSGGSTLAGDALFGATAPAAKTPGESLTVTADSPTGFTLDLGVTLNSPDEDVAVTTAEQPNSVSSGSLALLTDTVANGGPGNQPITLTDTVPFGLSIDAASVAGGTCSTAGQTVSCTIPSLAGGTSVPAYIVVTTSGAGSYANVANASIANAMDPNLANNSSSSTLTVTPAPTASTTTVTQTVTQTVSTAAPQRCTVVALKGLPQAMAKRVLTVLHCKVGKVKTVSSRTITKGDVITTTPGKGTFVAGRSVSLTVSGGKPKVKHTKRG